jgi:hypothetical protein
VDLEDFRAHLHAQMRIEVGQGLVEQEHGGIAHDGAPERDALALAARELSRAPFQERLDIEHRRGVANAPVDLVVGQFAPAQPERHVVVHRHVRIEAVVLEHHRDVPIADIDIIDAHVVETELAGAHVLQPGNDAQQRRLARAGRTDEHDELVVADVEVAVVQHRDVVVALLDVA